MKRKALFVGIDNYTRGIPALSCARNDANALLEYFQKHGYADDDVSILRDGRTSEILDELDEQTKRLKPGDLFLFFFAGHGYTIEKSDGSFDRCLAGADDRRDRIMRGKEGISLSEIKDRADKARCPFVVILDACQTKIDTSRAADISQTDVCNQRDLLAISSVVNRKSTSGLSIPFVVINSCDVGEVAYELKEKEQGLFTFAMLETLKQMENPVFDERLLALISSRMGEHGSGYSQHPKLMLADASDILDIPIFPVADSSEELLRREAELNAVLEAERLNAVELYQRGENYYYGRNGLMQDYSEAMKWYCKAAEQGHAEAQLRIGFMAMRGLGEEIDDDKARLWFNKAEANGNSSARTMLLCDLGLDEGMASTDPKRVFDEAEKLRNEAQFVKAAHKYYVLAGEAPLRAPEFFCKRSVAMECHILAQFWLGWMYYNGNGVSQNFSAAAKWYGKAANNENMYAQYWLGLMYEKGLGVEQNSVEAVRWYRQAAAQGLAEAKKALESLR